MTSVVWFLFSAQKTPPTSQARTWSWPVDFNRDFENVFKNNFESVLLNNFENVFKNIYENVLKNNYVNVF